MGNFSYLRDHTYNTFKQHKRQTDMRMGKRYLLALAMASALSASAYDVAKMNATTVMVTLDDGRHMYLDFYGDNIFRFFCDPEDGPVRQPEASPAAEILTDNPRRELSLPVSLSGDTVCTKAVKVTVDRASGCLQVWSGGRQVVRQTKPTDFGRKATSVTFHQSPGDCFYGGGVQNGRFSHGGQTIDIVNTNNWVDGGVASPTPFFWSTAGYAVMWYTFAPGHYDFGKTSPSETVISHDTDYLDIFVMVDEGATALLNDFYQLAGHPVLLPKFGFYEGHLNAYNRDYWTQAEDGKEGFMAYEDGKQYNESQKDNGGVKESLNGENGNYQFSARAAVDRYLDNDMPLGWILPNDGYGAGYGQTETLDGNIRNLKELGDYARSRGVEIGLWTQSDLHPKEGVEALLQRDIVKEVRDAGVRVLKTDVAWVGAGYSFGLNGVSDVAGTMPYYGSESRPFIISLDGWAGTQRYAGIWTGDQTGGEWEYIRFHIPTYIGSGLSGQPNITSDVDGIFGGKNASVNVRDYQWKTFSPMQLNMDGWGRNPKYPQALGEPATSINRSYLKLKSALMPYAYSIAHEAVNGKPMIRAMFLEDTLRNDYLTGKSTQYQFLYGPSLLVAPIYKETRVTEHYGVCDDVRDGIYLPKGEWMDVFDGKTYEGGRIINDFGAPIWKLPVFAKRSSVIPLTEPHNTPSECRSDLVSLFVVPGTVPCEFILYDDDGRSTGYLDGACVQNRITYSVGKKGEAVISINPTSGWYEGYEKMKEINMCIPAEDSGCRVKATCGGKKVAVSVTECEEASPFACNMGSVADQVPRMKMLKIKIDGKVNLMEHGVTVTVYGVQTDFSQPERPANAARTTPKADVVKSEPYSITPVWDTVPGAEYYEMEFQDMLYSDIRQTRYTLEDLTPDTEYGMKLRAVYADDASEWVPLTFRTSTDPLKYAICGITAETSCNNQDGQGGSHLFDFDTASIWHTEWGAKAVPFTIDIDLHSTNTLDRLTYLPRPDAGNGTLMECSYSVSVNGDDWQECGECRWERNGDEKSFAFADKPVARYIRINVTKAVGDFGSGHQIYVFRVPESGWTVQGDINMDGKLDENDLTSYTNYTGLRQGDSDFEGYVGKGDVNGNGLIDVQDIGYVATMLDGGVQLADYVPVEGTVTVAADKKEYKSGEEIVFTVSGKGLKGVNGISFCIPYDASAMEYVGDEPLGVVKGMYRMTYDRLHSSGQKALYPTYVNLGDGECAEGDVVLMKVRMKALVDITSAPVAKDIIVTDKRNKAIMY